MKAGKRNKLQIYYDILQLLSQKKETTNDGLSFTRVAHKANLPYDRFRNCLDQLIEAGMIARESDEFVVTKKGLDYIQWHDRMTDFLKHMGLPP
jgi:predicted transcriptional regulator